MKGEQDGVVLLSHLQVAAAVDPVVFGLRKSEPIAQWTPTKITNNNSIRSLTRGQDLNMLHASITVQQLRSCDKLLKIVINTKIS